MYNKASTSYIHDKVNQIFKQHPKIQPIIKALHENKCRVLLVGGSVRDIMLEKNIYDIDIEIHGQPLTIIIIILKTFGIVRNLGKSFGVIRIDGINCDFSIPRIDGYGRHPTVIINHNLSIKKAFGRRDLTINAMGIDLNTYKLIDPFNGLQDLKNKILRSPNISFFAQDPLRFYRVMQFISRFEMYPDDELNNICKCMNITNISFDRIVIEYKKLFTQTQQPSLGLAWLNSLNRIEILLPELFQLQKSYQINTKNNLFNVAMQTLNKIPCIENNTENKYILSLATLCYNIIPNTIQSSSTTIDNYSMNHAIISAQNLLNRLTNNKTIKETVIKLIKEKMTPLNLIINNSQPYQYKKIAKRLAPHTSIQMLYKLILVHYLSKNKTYATFIYNYQQLLHIFLFIAQKNTILHHPEPSIISGRDLIKIIKPGPLMKHALQFAYDIQIKKNINNKNDLIVIIMKNTYYSLFINKIINN